MIPHDLDKIKDLLDNASTERTRLANFERDVQLELYREIEHLRKEVKALSTDFRVFGTTVMAFKLGQKTLADVGDALAQAEKAKHRHETSTENFYKPRRESVEVGEKVALSVITGRVDAQEEEDG